MTGLDDEAWLAARSEPASSLPRPTRERWQPLRLGLVDLFHYDDEQFWFHDGRLLLRGNNGTGKSKVLALTLPFLLDGSVLPRRVEPDADPKKRMEWNLLLGGAHPHTERTGYSWVELGRRDADGTEHYATLGIGLKAAAGRGIVKTWYFTTSRRVGDLRLLDATRTVLSAERLREELDGSGHVHSSRDAYRRAVDETLFRLGEERYAALIDLLIGLRQPQLSKRPDEKALSTALTQALAPLDQAVVADVAESFRSLEEERAGIADVQDTLRAAEDFLKHYRVYAQVAARRHTTAVRIANSTYEHAGRDLHQAQADLNDAVAEVARVESAQEEARERQGVLVGQDQALRTSPEMRDAEQLHQAAEAADDMEHRARQAEAASARAQSRAQREAEVAAESARRHQATAADAEERSAEAVRRAAGAGLSAEHARIAADAAATTAALQRRRAQVNHVRDLVGTARAAAERAAHQRRVLDAAEAAAAARAEDLALRGEEVDAAVLSYRDQVRDYLGGLTMVRPEGGAETLVGLAEDWARSLADESPVRAAVDAAAATVLDALSRDRATAQHEAEQAEHSLAQLRERIAELESGRDPEPPAVPARAPDVRDGLPGAPLWRLIDFADDVPEDDRRGIEAALQSAGLLDAWLFPDGTLQADGDVVLGQTGARPAGRSLLDVLVPAVGPDSDVPEQAVAEVLGRLGLGEESGAPLWADPTGHWGAGPARGSWSKARAEYVGAGARSAHRRELLDRLRVDAAQREHELVSAGARVAEADRLATLVHAERAGHPAHAERELAAAHERLSLAGRELERARESVEQARTTWEGFVVDADGADALLAEAAADLGVGTTTDDLDAAQEAVTAYEVVLAELRSAGQAVAAAAAADSEARARAAEAAQAQEEAEQSARGLRTEAATLRSRTEALQETVGASVAELQVRLAEVSGALKGVGEDLERLARERITAGEHTARLEQKVEDLGRRREEAAGARERVIESLRAFAGTGLLRIALPALPDVEVLDPAEEWTVTAGLGLARNAEQRLGGADESDESWSRAQQRVSTASTELAAQMTRHGHTSHMDQREDVLVARVRYSTEEVDIDRLAERLATDVADRERLLSAHERDILETYLVDEVAGHLHELLLAAEGQLGRMNRELAERKTSTGMQLRVRWRERADGPAGLGAARDLLVRSDATWTAADRAAIGDFLQARIAEVRQADPAGGWQEHLEQALDYRQWHSFVVERWQNGQWRSASGPASGGEKALAVSVPLFAAAAAHYNSAGPHAPRLILLDEAFAGVDDDSRAKSLGLLATFDLDVVMTSEREWGCYPQVPGLSIAQLSRVEGVDAVGVTRWRWDGRRRERLGEVDDAARAGHAGDEPAAEESLFG